MSLASYLSGHNHSLAKAALNAADCLQVTVILITLLAVQRGQKVLLTMSDWASLLVACVAAGLWILTRSSWLTFFGFQVVMCIAYLPTMQSLRHWKADRPPEPMEKWGLNILIALIGLLVDVTGRHDFVAMVYPLRALVLCIAVVLLIARWESKSKAELPSSL